MKIDSHQHFWVYDQEEYDWIADDQLVLQRNFLPHDLEAVFKENGIDRSIAVQARQSKTETDWLLNLAENNPLIVGVVGWIDLKANDIEQQLALYSNKPLLKGFRHVLQGESDPNYMLDQCFINGLQSLEQLGFSYDLLIFAKQLPQTIALVEQLPNLSLVVDHIAKPDIKNKRDFSEWAEGMKQLAQFDNVYCKVSGMVTEADLTHWKTEDFIPFLDTVFNAFGPNRIMFGSDWPVCLLGGSYSKIKAIVYDYVFEKYPLYLTKVFGENAASFYNVS